LVLGGGLIGGFVGAGFGGVGAVPGSAIGAGVARAGIETVKNIFDQDDESFIKDASEVLFKGSVETVLDYTGAKLLGAVGKIPAVKKVGSRLGGKLASLLGAVPDAQKQRIINNTAKSFKQSAGVNEQATRRAFLRPKQVLTDEFMDIKKGTHLGVQTIKELESLVPEAFKQTKKQFEKEVIPIFKATKGQPFDGMGKLYNDFLATLSEKGSIDTVKGKLKFTGGSAIADKKVNRVINSFINEDIPKFLKEGDMESAHNLKKFIDDVVKQGSVKNNPLVDKIFKGYRSNINNLLRKNTKYGNVMDKYSDLFKVQETMGSLLDEKNVEKLIARAFQEDDVAFKNMMDKFVSNSGTAKIVWNDALDEWAGHEFASNIATQFSAKTPVSAGVETIERGLGFKKSPFRAGNQFKAES